jgi:hypothetical protein
MLKFLVLKYVMVCSLFLPVAIGQKAPGTKNLSASFISTDIRWEQGKTKAFKPSASTSTTAWKGEKISLQFLVNSHNDLENLRAVCSPLVSKVGGKINDVKCGPLRFVKTDIFAKGCGKHAISQYDSSMVADAIDYDAPVSVRAGQSQPFWISIRIPSDCKPGIYSGSITFNKPSIQSLAFMVKVIDKVLPSPDKWTFDLDLWQHPAAMARIHQVPLWSNKHFEYMRPYYEMLAQAGQKNITTSIINEPWGHQTYDDFPGLIKWIKQKDGNWRYDYSIFDQYVEFVMSCGIKKRINCYTMIPWSMTFDYFDENSGTVVSFTSKTDSEEYTAFWKTMISDFTAHLKKKNWFEITSISVDERELKDMQAAIKILKDVDSDWKISLAGAYHREIENDIFDYSIASNLKYDPASLEMRKKQGKPSTFYTCCVEEYPNGFTFSPPADHVWIGWYTASQGLTGYLRWAYNSWTKDPDQDSRFTAWPGGDTYQVYPGPKTSIRFEKLIEGIQDFEKINILKAMYKQHNQVKKLKQLENVLNTFKLEKIKDHPTYLTVAQAKKFINE